MNQPEYSENNQGKWLALAAALLGWMFDGLEMGLFPLVARPALQDLLHNPSEKEIGRWIAVATASFLIGAAAGGVLFGWLGDRWGRVRAMTLSVLTYALFSGACAFATDPRQIAILRFISALGMGGEWSLGVALVMEIWPDRSRRFLAGLIGAAANFGYLLIALIGLGLGAILPRLENWLLQASIQEGIVHSLVANSGWRLLMLLGAVPAILAFLIRMWVPESKRWQAEAGQGRTSHWEAKDLFGVFVGTAAAGMIIYLWAEDFHMGIRVFGSLLALVVVVLGYTFPVAQYLRRSAGDQTLILWMKLKP